VFKADPFSVTFNTTVGDDNVTVSAALSDSPQVLFFANGTTLAVPGSLDVTFANGSMFGAAIACELWTNVTVQTGAAGVAASLLLQVFIFPLSLSLSLCW
jgi:hypothetical protein